MERNLNSENGRNDFKWFGEGFEGFPKRLPEDCVEYSIFILDAKLPQPELRQRLRTVHDASSALIRSLLKDFIWQRESFELELVREDGTSLLRGRTSYGDSVEDEWLIVYILRELGKQFPDVWIRIIDTDGEFLLIEAANVLPKWLNPEVASNRVWLNNEQLLIIPLSQSGNRSGKANVSLHALTLQDALECILKDQPQLLHSPMLEAEAFYRLRNYPGQINESLHHASVTIPRRLAHVLHEKAAYISPAIEAFYLRDLVALRPLHAQKTEALFFPPIDFVTVLVKFTKVGYAQIKSQHFEAPRSWAGVIPSDSTKRSRDQAEMGLKLNCGFEMLLADSQNEDKKYVREIRLLLEDINSGKNQLPSNSEIESWEKREDSDTWLDINFQDFENQLGGERGERKTRSKGGFGDKNTQENLQKIVSRFEEFLNDDNAGNEGAEFADDMDNDNDDDEESNSISSEGEDKEISFSETHFTRMMREMMGLSVEEQEETGTETSLGSNQRDASDSIALDGESEDEEAQIQQISQAIEAELKDAGVFRLDTMPREKALGDVSLQVKDGTSESWPVEVSDEGSDDEEKVNIDYNLAKNLLESFKSQAGAAGPGGNLLGLMGVQLPRDEGDG